MKLGYEEDDIEVEYCSEHPKDCYDIETAQIIYNGLMIPEKYQLSCNYINFLPCISIKANNKNMIIFESKNVSIVQKFRIRLQLYFLM